VNTIDRNKFIFSREYRLQRHLSYWALHVVLWGTFWASWLAWTGSPFNLLQNMTKMVIWTPAFVAYSFPIIYGMIPRLLMRGKYTVFFFAIIGWGVAGVYFNMLYRKYVFIHAEDFLGFKEVYRDVKNVGSYLCMTTTAAEASILALFKHWIVKQRDWKQAEQEKMTAQLELLKAQLHPHFLFNTLNNIYAFALERSDKTPQLILKLSSLLSYMLYECRTDEVLLQKEIEVMKNYIDLEKERYGEKLDISLNIEGDIQDRFIAPLLILPFLENAFKHGTSEQIDKPWMSIDIAVKDGTMKCKVVNSKNAITPIREHGVGIENIKKRLELLYPDRHQLKLSDEGMFFVVSLSLTLNTPAGRVGVVKAIQPQAENFVHEIAMPAN
jgi:two-component system, LytTR family, sensor histidine kinase AlgZ